jgi:hypothetical protein
MFIEAVAQEKLKLRRSETVLFVEGHTALLRSSGFLLLPDL